MYYLSALASVLVRDFAIVGDDTTSTIDSSGSSIL